VGDTAAAVRRLGEWVAGLRWEDVPAHVRERLLLAVYDTLGVIAVGARLPENVALVRAWDPPPGPSAVIGAGRHTVPELAAWHTAACSLELDEGNKYARGHPAAHGFPAVVAMAQARPPVDGPTVCAALLSAYEVASRFGRATTLRPGGHPHGCWGTRDGGIRTARGTPTSTPGPCAGAPPPVPPRSPVARCPDRAHRRRGAPGRARRPS